MGDRSTSQCPICETQANELGAKRGGWRPLDYNLARCGNCGFAFVTNPSTDFAAIYDEAYYRGAGAAPLVDYLGELEHPDTIRRLEWEGVADAVRRLAPFDSRTRWLDYGCGMGGLVDYLSRVHGVEAEGFDEGMPQVCVALARGARIDRTTLNARAAAYDVITAIEVLEHVLDPLAVLGEIARLLKPGGVFFYTTGNAQKFKRDFLKWGYVRPEIHVSFYEPGTLRLGFDKVGLESLGVSMNSGFQSIIAFKILKELRKDRLAAWMKLIPWPIVARMVDARYGVTAFPMARKARIDGSAGSPEKATA
ncbi:MAG: class I SAM-dependent methyltransferase [Candidatus Eremiobacteraeota bacterium]|nr:class I SAM-dependent methyltransferase [Candidatus Eremiobacteraeota bacterium]